MATTKRIFVSDLHMGDERSLHPPGSLHPYGWLGEQRAALFAEFLQTRVLNDPDATELVILGDLFDVWVCPASIDPCHNGPKIEDYFQAIAAAKQNKGILDKLRTIASASKLTYVNGNHDMQLTEAIAKSIIPNVRYQEQEVYENQAEGIHAEHAHHYTLCNAKDAYNTTDGASHIVPSGYFISRLAAQYTAETGKDAVPILQESMQEILEAPEGPITMGRGSLFISALYRICQAKYLYLGKTTMDGFDQFGDDKHPLELSADQIISLYQDVDKRWSNRVVSILTAIADDIGSYITNDNLKKLAASIASCFNQRLIVFGHTHHAALELVASDVQSLGSVLYANTGSWVDSIKQCTALETWQMGEALWVTLYEYLGKGQRRILTRFVRPTSAPGFQPIAGHYLPPGSYITTSQNIRLTLSATCQDPKGRQYDQTLELTTFDGAVDIINDNGKLRLSKQPINPNDLERIHDAKQRLNCGRYVPDGTYLLSSSNVHVTLSATCQRINPTEWKNSTIDITSFTAEVLIENDDGDLHVSEKGEKPCKRKLFSSNHD